MSTGDEARAPQQARIGPVLHHGNGVALTPGGPAASVPFTLPGEIVELVSVPGPRPGDATLLRILEPSPERIEPACPHFGLCGGCHVQMASPAEQLRLKQAVLLDWLTRAGLYDLPDVQVHAGEPWGYRNRIRLRVGRDGAGGLRFGYNRRGSRHFLPIRTCPISAPLLWRAAELLLAAAAESTNLYAWLSAAAEVELFASHDLSQLQLLLFLEGTAPARADTTFANAMEVMRAALPELAGAGAVLLGPQPRGGERTRTPLTAWGAAGLHYTVAEERYWVSRGRFFQVNRFLLPELVHLVCANRSGQLAWDLFAGVGLFARPLARGFEQVTAVEGNPLAAHDLHAALRKISKPGRAHRAKAASILDFLREAAVQRERPDLITLDPPRAGIGEPACELLLRIRAPEMVYVSCDPETLARDLAILARGYRLAALHLVDMFPQTYHQETVAVLHRRA